ncbi:hypothetical protein NU688_17510 [Variovorax sp. ZS18.2.2]|uniref:hypothetical protein n=1 Tax=Variovorax sp. ZS18.2.2 TaxID=2971255 RepID=UPI0021515E83|nr:hypothetical protein [Variovorax sp. ZS18.2.2]MCR6477964.1 hypothetical protein [Variovorax sp. ZS18.2.2]
MSFVPVASEPPPAPTPETAPPAPAPVTVETPPVDPPPPKPVEKAVKNIRVLNFQTPTYTQPADQRLKSEDIKTYTQRALQAKFALLRDALTAGLPKKSAPTDLCYFVVPEFFWNVNWDAVQKEDDIRVFSATCVVEVQKHVRALIALFPQEQYGKLALLPGTAQVLMKQLVNAGPAPLSDDESVDDEDLPPYEALNYVLVIDNFSKANPDGSRPISMWPKRNVSGIDFYTYGRTTVMKDGRAYWKVRLGPFNILVLKKSTTTAVTLADGKEIKAFDNDPLGGVPFGVDVCLDYALAYTEEEYLRMSQIEDTNYIIDFLIACGMTADPSTHKYLPSVQYIVRNDGMNATYPPPYESYSTYGTCEIFKLSAPEDKDGIALRPVNVMVPQTQVASPGPNSILFDSYFDVHPLGQYPSTDLPTEPLPSLITPPPPSA